MSADPTASFVRCPGAPFIVHVHIPLHPRTTGIASVIVCGRVSEAIRLVRSPFNKRQSVVRRCVGRLIFQNLALVAQRHRIPLIDCGEILA
jgi:hypothetical protein